jgi:hypothetical protein
VAIKVSGKIARAGWSLVATAAHHSHRYPVRREQMVLQAPWPMRGDLRAGSQDAPPQSKYSG